MYHQTACGAFVVEGSGKFPVCMLNEDDCYQVISGENGEYREMVRRVYLISRESIGFTAERWSSFGWNVIVYGPSMVGLTRLLKGRPTPFSPPEGMACPLLVEYDFRTGVFVTRSPQKPETPAKIHSLLADSIIDEIADGFSFLPASANSKHHWMISRSGLRDFARAIAAHVEKQS